MNSKEIIRAKTQHFSFDIIITSRFAREIEISKHFQIGDNKIPCLSLFLYTSDASAIMGNEIIKTANLSNIESLYSCVLDDIDTFNKYSLSFELINYIIKYIKTNYKHIKHIKLDDESYIPCNKETNDTVDLLTYSIAHYGKTWYEKQYNGYLPNNKYEKYRSEVNKYCSIDFKKSISWDEFILVHFNSSTEFAYKLLNDNIDKYKELFEKSKTFPEFFIELTKTIPKDKKCSFYKHWLQQFINSIIHIERRWVIDIYNKNNNKRNTLKNKNS